MTDSTNPPAPRIPRKKPRREPASIDVPAKVIAAGPPAGEAIAAEQIEPSASEAELIREAVAAEMAAPTEPGTAAEGVGETSSFGRGASGDDGVDDQTPDKRPSSFLPLAAAGLLGGVIGAGLMFALQLSQAPQLQDVRQDSQRLAALEQRLTSTAPAGAVQSLQGRIQALEAAKASADERLSAAQSAADQALSRASAPAPPRNEAAVSELTQRLSGLEGQVQSTQQSAADARQAIETQVVDLSRRVSQGPDDTTKAAIRIVLAQQVAQALRQGTPYAETLQALRQNGTEASRLAPLESFAAKGAPTAASLAETFRPLSAVLLRNDRAETGSLTDRFLRMADRIVTIRPVNEPGAKDLPGLVARIEQALESGNVKDALAAWEALPEPARRLSEAWGAQVKARAAADASAQEIANASLSALGNPTQ